MGKYKEHPILFSDDTKDNKAKGCFRAGLPRPWSYKGGRKAAQARYREKHREAIKERKHNAYHRDPQANAARSMQWRKDNPEKWQTLMRKSNKRQRERLRSEMLAAYGGECVCCGEKLSLFLNLDHIYNDGNVDRKLGNGGGVKLLGRLKKQGWPTDKYQLLCCNCNQGKRLNKGICPHKDM